ncbi:MAG: hypothetical protein V7L23_27530 [Nostoc sp.]
MLETCYCSRMPLVHLEFLFGKSDVYDGLRLQNFPNHPDMPKGG